MHLQKKDDFNVEFDDGIRSQSIKAPFSYLNWRVGHFF